MSINGSINGVDGSINIANEGGGGPCGACKFLRRKCVPGCIFAPYFDPEIGAAHFAAVHKVFGASNVSKLLQHIPVNKRLDTVITVCYEAQARMKDPVHGCLGLIFYLQQQVVSLQNELRHVHAHQATLSLPPPPPFPPQLGFAPPQLSFSDLPPASSIPATFDLSFMFDPITQPSWPVPPQTQVLPPLMTRPPAIPPPVTGPFPLPTTPPVLSEPERSHTSGHFTLPTTPPMLSEPERSPTFRVFPLATTPPAFPGPQRSSAYSADDDFMDLHEMARKFLHNHGGGPSNGAGNQGSDDQN